MRLRTKVSLLFGIIALIATVSLTVVTYAFARSSPARTARRTGPHAGRQQRPAGA